ncbi:MAG: DUF5777 family beta-barrel protein [Acidobacteriota bacterium]
MRACARPGACRLLPAVVTLLAVGLLTPAPGLAQDPTAPVVAKTGGAPATEPAPAPAAQADDQDEVDREVKKVEPDFTVIALPTTLRVPRHGAAFRLTHRFTRALDVGSFGDLASDFFGLDGGAVIGLEFRVGLARGLQAGAYRTSDKTIELFGQYDVFQQGPARPAGLNVLVAVEGLDNFTEEFSPAIGAILSRALGDRLALYAQPMWVGHTRVDVQADPLDGHDHRDGRSTFMLGLGTRVRLGGSTYLTFETAPRLAGFAWGDMHVSFGIEKRAGGHVFQVNVSNGVGSTPAQLARGVHTHGESFWFLGFNLSRKFY